MMSHSGQLLSKLYLKTLFKKICSGYTKDLYALSVEIICGPRKSRATVSLTLLVPQENEWRTKSWGLCCESFFHQSIVPFHRKCTLEKIYIFFLPKNIFTRYKKSVFLFWSKILMRIFIVVTAGCAIIKEMSGMLSLCPKVVALSSRATRIYCGGG